MPSYAPLWCTILLFLSPTHPSLACSFFSRLFAEERDISLDEIYDDNNEKPKHLHQSKFHHSQNILRIKTKQKPNQKTPNNLSLSISIISQPISLSTKNSLAHQTCVYIPYKHFHSSIISVRRDPVINESY